VTVRADTENMQAYELYLKARENFIARKDLPETVQLFERVVELDPKFARGWEGLAATCSVMRSWGFDDRDYTNMAKSAAEHALQLDPTLSMPWAVLANVENEHWPVDWSHNLGLLNKAIAADPKNATAWLWRSIAWIHLGFFDRAIADQNRCLALEPGYHNCLRHKALALLFAGRVDEAITLFNRGLANGFVISRSENFVAPLLQRGDQTAALLLLDASQVRPGIRAIVMTALSKPDAPRVNAKAIVDRYFTDKNDPMVKNLGLSRLYLWLGDYDQVASVDDSATGAIVAWDRYPASFRNSPGMKLRLVRMGVPAYWREHGYPAQCRALGSHDFICDEIHP
jgi:adenylate cyclase